MSYAYLFKYIIIGDTGINICVHTMLNYSENVTFYVELQEWESLVCFSSSQISGFNLCMI